MSAWAFSIFLHAVSRNCTLRVDYERDCCVDITFHCLGARLRSYQFGKLCARNLQAGRGEVKAVRKSPWSHIFLISLSLDAKSLWCSVNLARASDCKLSVLISSVRLSRWSSIARTLVFRSATRSSCFAAMMSFFNFWMRVFFPSISERIFCKSLSSNSTASTLLSVDATSDWSFA